VDQGGAFYPGEGHHDAGTIMGGKISIGLCRSLAASKGIRPLKIAAGRETQLVVLSNEDPEFTAPAEHRRPDEEIYLALVREITLK